MCELLPVSQRKTETAASSKSTHTMEAAVDLNASGENVHDKV